MSQSVPANTHLASSAVTNIATFAERQQEKFPLNTFFSLQTFSLFNGAVEFAGSLIEYPLAILQLPFGGVLPSKNSEIQTAINTARYRNINTDII